MRPCMGHWAQYQPLREHWEQWGEPQIPHTPGAAGPGGVIWGRGGSGVPSGPASPLIPFHGLWGGEKPELPPPILCCFPGHVINESH